MAAGAAQRLRPPPGPYTDTASGPRNSNALAVPSGMRATASMNSSIRPAVTAPSALQATRSRRVKRRRRGRTRTTRSTPAQASRSPVTPSGPSWPNRWTDSASPSWTQDMDATAISAPPPGPARARAEGRWYAGAGELMTPVERPVIVYVHVPNIDIPSKYPGQ
jgi:hypothetical protein